MNHRRRRETFQNLPSLPPDGMASPLSIVTSVPVLQWCRADFGVSGDVAANTWLDLSQYGNHYSQFGDGQAPAVLASDPTLSGLQALTFDGVNHRLVSPGPTTKLPFFLIAVIKMITWRASAQMLSNTSGVASGHLRMTVSSPRAGATNGFSSTSNLGSGLGVWERYQVSFTGTAADFLRRGATITTDSFGSNTATGRAIGGPAALSLRSNIAIRELIHFGGTPSAPELFALDSYFAAQSASIIL